MSKVYTSVLDLIGHTPLLEPVKFGTDKNLQARLLVKLESFNPAGSAKDRIAKAMIEDADKSGASCKKGGVIIEPTSGNTGIGLAAVAAMKGYRAIMVMPETMSIERRNMIAAYGAEVVLTEAKKGIAGSVEKARELAASIPGSFIPEQFDNPANPAAHKATTGPEIYEDTDGAVDHFRGRGGHRRHPHRCGRISEGKETFRKSGSCGTGGFSPPEPGQTRSPQDPGHRHQLPAQDPEHQDLR